MLLSMLCIRQGVDSTVFVPRLVQLAGLGSAGVMLRPRLPLSSPHFASLRYARIVSAPAGVICWGVAQRTERLTPDGLVSDELVNDVVRGKHVLYSGSVVSGHSVQSNSV
jgi:hypothetical protein